MLIFKEITNENLIKDFIKEFDIPYKKSERAIIYGGFDGDILFGLCKINLVKDHGVLDYLIISHSYKGDNLGDALLKSTLNKLDNMGIKEVIYLFLDDYLIKKGFVKREKDLYVALPGFFNKQCTNCGGKDEI